MNNFNIGQFVIYPKHGLGEITGIENIEVLGNKEDFLIIKCERSMTLRLPVSKAEKSGLRPLATEAEAKKALAVLKGAPRPQMGMWSRRSREIDDKVNSGNLVQMCQVLRDLTPRNKSENGLSYSERIYYERAMSRLIKEVALIRSQDEQKVKADVEKLLSQQPPLLQAA